VSLQRIFGFIVELIDQLLVCSNSLPTWLVTSQIIYDARGVWQWCPFSCPWQSALTTSW
jgi:hypothetical protein